VLFDLDHKPQRINIELETSLARGAEMVAMQSKTFGGPYRPRRSLWPRRRRKDFEDNVMTTFYLRNASTRTSYKRWSARSKEFWTSTGFR